MHGASIRSMLLPKVRDYEYPKTVQGCRAPVFTVRGASGRSILVDIACDYEGPDTWLLKACNYNAQDQRTPHIAAQGL